MRKGENYNTGVTPNLRPKNKRILRLVLRAAEVVAFLNKAAEDENK